MHAFLENSLSAAVIAKKGLRLVLNDSILRLFTFCQNPSTKLYYNRATEGPQFQISVLL